MSVRLYIGNLPKEVIDKSELQAIFAEEGNAVTTKLIKDRKTGKCRGFGFITVNNDEKADQIIEKYNGQMFKETAIKIEKALPRSKGEENNEEQAAKASSGAGSSQKEGKKGKKSRRNAPKETSSSNHHDSDAVRPDPRWAAELEKLKEMLAAQATN